MNFLTELKSRDMIYQSSNITNDDTIHGIYCGFDITAQSLQIGNLIPIAFLKLAASYNKKIIVVLGGATTQIGDPTNRNDARPQLNLMQINDNMQKIESQIKNLLPEAKIVNNATWFKNFEFMDFLNDVAHYISAGSLLKLDMFANRLKNHEPLTLKELIYPLMQAYDFLWLYENEKCNMQIGASDQWCNILTGYELIKKKHKDANASAITLPLLTNKDGSKMGKSTAGAIFIDKKLCSVYDFWQFFRNIDDILVKTYLKKLTLISLKKIEEIQDINQAKIILANEITIWVHGKEEAEKAKNQAEEIFINKNIEKAQHVNCKTRKLVEIIAFLTKKSNAQAKILIIQGAIKINNNVVFDKNYAISDIKCSIIISKKQIFNIEFNC